MDEESDQFKSDLLDSYCKLSLRDPKKNEILKKWLNDKSCSWWASYAETTTVGTTWSHDTFKGYGTKWLSCICVVLLYFDFYWCMIACFLKVCGGRYFEDAINFE